jgi:hypothetical protein
MCMIHAVTYDGKIRFSHEYWVVFLTMYSPGLYRLAVGAKAKYLRWTRNDHFGRINAPHTLLLDVRATGS